MTDEFDDLATGSYTPEAPTIVPAGRQFAMVTDAMRRKDKFKAGKWLENPSGWVLTLTLQAKVGDDTFTFKSNIPAHRSKVIGYVFKSAGLDAPVTGTPVTEGELVGRTVEVEIEHFTPEGGTTTYPLVKRWLEAGTVDADPPDLPPLPAKVEPKKPRGATAKTAAAFKENAPDDIPF